MRALNHDRNRQEPCGRATTRQSLAAWVKRAYTGADAHGEKDSLPSGVAGA